MEQTHESYKTLKLLEICFIYGQTLSNLLSFIFFSGTCLYRISYSTNGNINTKQKS